MHMDDHQNEFEDVVLDCIIVQTVSNILDIQNYLQSMMIVHEQMQVIVVQVIVDIVDFLQIIIIDIKIINNNKPSAVTTASY
jgi:hypothetical protein